MCGSLADGQTGGLTAVLLSTEVADFRENADMRYELACQRGSSLGSAHLLVWANPSQFRQSPKWESLPQGARRHALTDSPLGLSRLRNIKVPYKCGEERDRGKSDQNILTSPWLFFVLCSKLLFLVNSLVLPVNWRKQLLTDSFPTGKKSAYLARLKLSFTQKCMTLTLKIVGRGVARCSGGTKQQ